MVNKKIVCKMGSFIHVFNYLELEEYNISVKILAYGNDRHGYNLRLMINAQHRRRVLVLSGGA